MARTREFDVSEALRKATIMFWRQGYRDTSMEQLVKATGVSRYGFYQEFGNKKELFKRCLQEYSLSKISPGLKRIAQSNGELEDLRCFFSMYSENIAEHGANGCLICNTATEIGETDMDVNSIVRDIYAKLTAQFQHFIERAQARSEVRQELSAFDLSVCLLGVLQGVAVMARSDFHRDTLRQYLTTIFDMMAEPE
ncbi:transcriptional regulator, TetR family [Pseudoalteromonas sp. SW0106-04]|uniref:TetR/AcrR family transcriptional regulator n=1 Tax=Pseudoalteromonas sp. SW0106-04 TaxID=1702169 RepID=UPI0006B4C295|nr:TetR/AcrR family transcriptional regulator [Pseudoalteromonas sp. SW0106-04]GAP74628.1 transcriptional regulator, TetR family [Pseudoalteromonas sp. SW0106-04]